MRLLENKGGKRGTKGNAQKAFFVEPEERVKGRREEKLRMQNRKKVWLIEGRMDVQTVERQLSDVV